ncbi:MAG: DUF1573 domain-containing protein [Acidobacteria bacterium]|nr:DUF1573 domain-containing protein [Acidobacteriota bacterium]
MKRGKASVTAGSIFCMAMLFAGLSAASEDSAIILKATPDHYDAGTVAEGKTVEATATLQNVGDTPVEITNVRTS